MITGLRSVITMAADVYIGADQFSSKAAMVYQVSGCLHVSGRTIVQGMVAFGKLNLAGLNLINFTVFGLLAV
jgi:hypothetical protein